MSDFTLYITQQDIDNINKFKDSDDWDNYKDKIHETDLYDATYLGNKYGIDIDFTPINISKNDKIYITKTRNEWYVQKTLKKYGASKLSGQHMKHTKGSGSSKKTTNKSKNKSPKTKFNPPPYNIENIHIFDYDYMLSCEEDKKFDKMYRIKFDHEYYNSWQIKMYKDIEDKYYEDLKNGNIDIINSFVRRLSTYMRINKLCIDKNDGNMIEGSIICNIALMINKYIKTGNFDTNIDWINKLSVNDLNDFDNIYVLFLLLQIFSCKYKYKKLYMNGRFIKDWWAINLIRRRDKNEDTKTLGILPRFNRTETGDTIYELY